MYRAIGNTPSVTAATAADVDHDGMVTFDDIFAVYRAIGGAELTMIAAPATPALAATVIVVPSTTRPRRRRLLEPAAATTPARNWLSARSAGRGTSA